MRSINVINKVTKKVGRILVARSKKVTPVKEDVSGTNLNLAELEKAGFTILENSTYASVDNRIPTGLIPFDSTMGGGIPMGRIVEIASPNGVGKSNLAIQMLKSSISMGVKSLLIDVEGTADKEHLDEMGLDISKVFVKQNDPKKPEAMSVEAVGEAIDSIIDIFSKVDKPVLIIWDSAGATPGRKTLEKGFDDEQPGVQAKAITKVIQKVTPKITNSKSSLIVVNQVRSEIGGFGGGMMPSYVTPGGKALEHSYSLRYMLGKAGDIKKGQEYMGHKVRFKNKKSKVSKPFQKADQFLYGGMGLNEMVNIVFTAEDLGFVKVPSAGGRKVEVPNKETGELEKLPYFDFLDVIATPDGAEEYMYFLKPLFQKIIKHYFPADYPPIHNTEIDITQNELYQGLDELYKEEDKSEQSDTEQENTKE